MLTEYGIVRSSVIFFLPCSSASKIGLWLGFGSRMDHPTSLFLNLIGPKQKRENEKIKMRNDKRETNMYF